MALERVEKRAARRERVRRKVLGTDSRPRLSIYRSLHHVYAQAISDESGRTLASASTMDTGLRAAIGRPRSPEAAKAVGKAIAARCIDQGIKQVVFDRNGFLYHGKIKVLAEAAREAGLRF